MQKRYIKLKKTNSNNDDFANILSNAKRVPISDNLHYSLYSNRVDKTKLTTNTIPYAKSLGHPLMFERMHGYSKPTTYIYYAPTQRTKQDCNLFIVRPDGEITHPTPEVMEELQGFPIGYTEIAGVSKTQRIKQVGNAISPVMVQHFISNLI
ncbi:MAG: DNA cytosine methyltransferase [Candidatus Peribacteria bacterium]|nr:DNA cytosine methyltransferase [Candidatus Peribacteria bacterium]